MKKKTTLIVTLALLLSNAMAGLDGTIINTALPAIVSDLHAIAYMGWITAVFLLGMAVVTPLWSKLGEKIGNKRAYQIATALFAVGAVFQAFSSNIVFFLIARTIMGIGAGGMNTLPFIIYVDLYQDLKKRARVIGYATASFSAASIIGPLVGGWLVDSFSWHWVFYINLPIALISIVCVQFYFKEPKRKRANDLPVDLKGAAVMVSALVILLLGIQMIGQLSALSVGALLALGIVLLIYLTKVEAVAKDPIIPNRLFHNPHLVMDFLLFALLWGAFIAFNIYIPMWAQGIMGLSALIGGMTQIPGSITNFFGSMAAPGLQSKVGKYQLILAGTLCFLVSFGGLFLAGITIPFWFLLVMGAFEGFGLGMCFNILQVSVQEDAQLQDVPIATSFAYLLRILSQSFMSSIYGVMLTHAITKGVTASHGEITVEMMNKLSNVQSAVSLPKHLVPQMRQILFDGIHSILLLAIVLLLVALVLNLVMQKRLEPSVKTKFVTKKAEKAA